MLLELERILNWAQDNLCVENSSEIEGIENEVANQTNMNNFGSLGASNKMANTTRMESLKKGMEEEKRNDVNFKKTIMKSSLTELSGYECDSDTPRSCWDTLDLDDWLFLILEGPQVT